jgi:hypothetical protein
VIPWLARAQTQATQPDHQGWEEYGTQFDKGTGCIICLLTSSRQAVLLRQLPVVRHPMFTGGNKQMLRCAGYTRLMATVPFL